MIGENSKSHSRAPRRRAARVALQASPIPHQWEIVALAAGLARIALHPRLGAFVDDARDGLRLMPGEFGKLAMRRFARACSNVGLQSRRARRRETYRHRGRTRLMHAALQQL